MIPVNEPLVEERELALVTDCIKSGWISSAGSYLTRFENEWARYCGQAHGIGVTNGTAALQVAVRALDIGPGDEVIMPTFTIISCALAVVEAGAIPVLVDADPATWCIDADQIESKITSRTKAIMVVHVYGHPVDMARVMRIAHKHGLAVIEDAAEAHGAECRVEDSQGELSWQRCGSFGTVSTFSFYANKIITTGEGGMVLTSDDGIAQRCRMLRNLCFESGRRFLHHELSGNYRLTNVQAALGVAQMERVDRILDRKRWLGVTYGRLLSDIAGIQLPITKPWARHVFWMYGIVIDKATGMDAAVLADRLHKTGVETRPFFLGMHEQPVLQSRRLFRGEHYPVAERIARQGLYLPSGLAITEEQLYRVAEAVRTVMK